MSLVYSFPVDQHVGPPPFIVLSREDLSALMPFGDYADAVAEASLMHAEGCSSLPPPMHAAAEGGSFHVKVRAAVSVLLEALQSTRR